MGLHHNHAVTLLGRCDCTCHRGQRDQCWCGDRPNVDTPIQMHHNDTLRSPAGRCWCPCHRGGAADCWCRKSTPSDIRRALERLEQRRRPTPAQMVRDMARGQLGRGL